MFIKIPLIKYYVIVGSWGLGRSYLVPSHLECRISQSLRNLTHSHPVSSIYISGVRTSVIRSIILVTRPKLGRPSQWPWVRLLICVGIPTQRLGRTAYAFLPKNMATTMNATVRGWQKQYILHLRKQIILKLS